MIIVLISLLLVWIGGFGCGAAACLWYLNRRFEEEVTTEVESEIDFVP